MSRYTLDAFRQRSTEKDRGDGVFELETDRFLEVHLNGTVWTKKGSMVGGARRAKRGRPRTHFV